jgi:hypothetical protein
MGNVAVAEELAGSDELEELYRLDASESEPEDEPDDEDQDDEDQDDEDQDGGRGGSPRPPIQDLARSNTGQIPVAEMTA